jgi:hypothetical protein
MGHKHADFPAKARHIVGDAAHANGARSTTRPIVSRSTAALALRLGHRQSVDFDFFSYMPFDPEALGRTP